MNKEKRFKLAVAEVRSLGEADKRRREEKGMDKWFNGLTMCQLMDLARSIWENLDFEEKSKIFYIE